MKIKDNFHLYALATILFGSLAYVLTRLLMQHFSVFSLGFLRYLIASCALLFVVFYTKLKPPSKKDLPWFMLSGLIGFFLYIILFNKGQSTTNAATGSIIMATVPVLTSLFARIIYHEKLKVHQWIAICVEFFGVIILTLFNGIFSLNYGIFWLLLTAVNLSFYNLLQRKLTKKYQALQVSTYGIFFATILLSIFSPSAVKEVTTASSLEIFYLLVLGIFSSAIACTCWTKAFSTAPKTSQVTNYMFLTPFLASLLGFLLAGEIPDKATMFGGLVIFLGMIIFNFGNNKN